MGNFIDLTGNRYGRLTVIERVQNAKRTKWRCKCDCGNIKEVYSFNLMAGKIKSCGCLRQETAAILASNLSRTTHSQSKTPMYKVWAAMKDRCFNKENSEYHNYGGRGITVCEEWKNDFKEFYDWSIKNGYKQGLSIDRINGDKNYCPENCRWTTAKVQGNNTRRNHWIEYNGEIHTIAEWADIKGIKYNTLNGRIHRGWSIKRALGE